MIERAVCSEDVDVSSREIQNMLNKMEKENVDIHSIMVLRYGKVACEAYKSPFSKADVHMMYSVSKSFLSVAFGFAYREGLWDFSTKFADIFPEYKNSKDKKLSDLKIVDLLGMCSGKRTARLGNDWLKSFVNAKWDFAPGKEWRYVNENYYALAEILVKLTGMSVTDYLTPRLYIPLDISVPLWEKSPKGIEAGGWGLFLTTEDLAKFILCCHNKGVYRDVQVIPAQWLELATSNLFDNSLSQTDADSKAGYGYGFWQCAGMKNTFRCEGMYSQYAISFLDYDACIIITSGCAALQKTLDIVWEFAEKAFTNKNLNQIKIHISPSYSCDKSLSSKYETEINGKIYKIHKCRFVDLCGYPVSSIPMPALFFAKEKGGSITDLSFHFSDDGFNMCWTENGGYVNMIFVPLNGTFAKGRITIGEITFDVAATGKWNTDNELEVLIKPLAAVATRKFVFVFKDRKIRIYPDMIPSIDEKAEILGEKLKSVLKGKYFEWWIDVLVPRVRYILQPTHYGKEK